MNSLDSMDLYRLAATASQDGLWVRDLKTNEIWYSDRWKEIIGYAPGEFRNDFNELAKRVHSDDAERWSTAIEDHLSNPDSKYECEFRLQHKDGSYRHIRARGRVLYDEHGVAKLFAGSHTDITDEIRQKVFFEAVLNSIPTWVFVKDERFRFTYANSALCQGVGADPRDIIGRTDAELFSNENEVESFNSDDRKVIETGVEVRVDEEQLTTQRGERKTLSTVKIPLDVRNSRHVLGVATDISAVVGEQSLVESILEHVDEAVYLSDIEGRILRANRLAAELANLQSGKEIVGHFDAELLGDEGELDRDQLCDGTHVVAREVAVEGSGGKRYYLKHKVAIRDDAGKVVHVVGVIREITELKNREVEFQRQAMLLETVLNTLPQYIFAKDREGRYIVANASLAQKLGTSPREMTGRTAFDFFPRDVVEAWSRIDRSVIEHGDPVHLIETVPFGDKAVQLEVSKLPLHDVDGRVVGFVCIGEETSDDK